MKTDAHAVKLPSYLKVNVTILRYVLCTLLISLVVSYLPVPTEGATKSELATALEKMNQAVDKKALQDVEVINALSVVTAPAQSVTIGVVAAFKGSTLNIPIYFKEGNNSVAALQFDVTASSGIEVLSASAGIAATASDKQVASNAVANGYRVVVFGINQTVIKTAIPSGPIVVLRVRITDQAVVGKRILLLTGSLASDPDGNGVALTSKNGSLTVK